MIKHSEQYWTQRNALVDAAKSADPGPSVRAKAFAARTQYEACQVRVYARHLDALKAFDAAHGGAPVL